jgi:hypothetical protein
MCSPRDVIAEFTKLQEAIAQTSGEAGKTIYQEILQRHGVQHAGDFKRSQPARLCAKELFQALQGLSQNSDVLPGIGVVEGVASEAEPGAELAISGGQQNGD